MPNSYYQYPSTLSGTLSGLSSFARGWASMQLQLEAQEEAQSRWKQEFDFRKKQQTTAEEQWKKGYDMQAKKLNQQASIAQRQYDFENMKWEAGEALRSTQNDVASLNLEIAQSNKEYTEQVREETKNLNEYMFSTFPDLMNTPSEKFGQSYLGVMTDAMRTFPNADVTKWNGLFKIISSSNLFTHTPAKIVSTPMTYVDEKGKKKFKYVTTDGKEAFTFDAGVRSDEVLALAKTWREKLQTRRKEMFTAFSTGSTAKFKGEFNINIQDLNDLDVNFHDIASFADQLLEWVAQDPDTKKMRGQFYDSLDLVVEDDKERQRIVESVFGPTPTLKQEADEETISRYSGIYKSMVLDNRKTNPQANALDDFAFLYENIFTNYEAGERELLTRSLKAAAQNILSAAEYEELLGQMDYIAQVNMLTEEDLQGPPEPPPGWQELQAEEELSKSALFFDALGAGF